MVRMESRRNAKRSPNIRCESADSGVDTSLNNTVSQQLHSSGNEFNGLEEEHLDFEPEIFDAGCTDGTDRHSQYVNSDESTVKILESDGKDPYSGNESVSTVSIGHGRHILPVPQIDAKDGRQNEYLPFVYTISSSTKTILDSSSDDISSDSDINKNIHLDMEDDISRSQNDTDDYMEDYSDYEICQEIEDRLLGSSDDECDESQPVISKSLIETCHIGNARITLPTFTSNFQEETRRDGDLKRPKPVKSHNRLYKKKKWDLRFIPESIPMRIFLNDIGYTPPSSSHEDEDSDHNSDSNVPHLKKLYVICNEKDKIVCEKPEEEFQRDITTFCKSDHASFKLPLPPPKRPPTRPKRTVSNSESYRNLQIKVVNRQTLIKPKWTSPTTSEGNNRDVPSTCGQDEMDDDSLSIIASSIGENNEETFESNPFGLTNISAEILKHTEGDEFESLKDASCSKEYVESWIQNVNNPETPESISNFLSPSGDEMQSVVKTDKTQPTAKVVISTMPSVNPNGNPRIDFKGIPPMFHGLCYFEYFYGKCTRLNRCPQSHSVTISKFISRIEKMSQEDMIKCYNFAQKFEKLFKEICPCFIKVFGSKKMLNELIKVIKDILQLNSINATDTLEMILEAFVESGLSFYDAIEKISFNVGFFEYPILADILLDLMSRKPNIADHWELMNRIAKARGQISPDIVKRILNRIVSVYPVDIKLALDVYNVIIKNKMTDISQISDELLAPFRAMTGFTRTGLTQAPSKIAAPVPSYIPYNQPVTASNEREVLAATIDHNLIKARERFEREAEGRNMKTMTMTIRNSSTVPEDTCFVRSYDYAARKTTNPYDKFADADDRYFPANRRQEINLHHDSPPQNILNRFIGNPMFTASGSSSSHESFSSPNSSLHFEPPEVGEYVPDIVKRKEIRIEPSVSKNYVSVSQPPVVGPGLKQQDSDITLTPPFPIFGNASYRRDFVFDKSLHNLLPDVLEHVNINERDVAKLNHVIKSKNGAEFYELIEYYKKPSTIKNFITMTIAHLKACENGLYEVFVDLVEALEIEKPDYAKTIHIKAILEVVTMNILFELERKGQWDKARKLLERFCDWDSLISSQLLQIFPQRRLTHMGRYIFLAKIFASGRNYHFTYEILQCKSLHLLESFENWPYECDPQVDLKYRNSVLTDFFQDGYRYNIADVSDMYRNIFKYGGIDGYDALIHFNPMLISIMNNHQISLLKHFYLDINLYHKLMDKNVLRAFTILLAEQLTQEELFVLYDLCCDRQIYTYYTGGETSIILRVNMLDVEVRLILNYYFEKISRSRRVPHTDVTINITLFNSKVLYPKILQKCIRSIQEINEKVKEILVNDFGILVRDPPNTKATEVEIKRTLIEDWLQRSLRWSRVQLPASNG